MPLTDLERYTIDLMGINSYQVDGKLEAIEYVRNILEQKTNAVIEVNTEIEPCLIARIEGSNSNFKLLLEGHLDVVNGEAHQFIPQKRGSMIYGRGSADMKSGCACILSAFIDAAQDTELKGDVTLVFTTDEETTGASIKHLFDNNHLGKHDFAMIPEPTNGQICNAHKGQSWISVEFHGVSAHSSLPMLGQNAIYMAMDFVQVLRRNTQNYKEDPYFGKESISVGVIEGGTDPNVVPDYAKVRIDKRYLPHQDVQTGLDEVQIALNECRENDPMFRASVHLEGDWSGLLTEPDISCFPTVLDTISQQMNQKTNIVYWTAWGEGAFISQYGIPTIYFGPGDTQLAHTQNEHVDMKQVHQVKQTYSSLINTLCGMTE